MTADELKEYSREHLSYEIQMLLNVGRVSLYNVPLSQRQFLTNILLESFAIHLRNLISFLYPTSNTKPTDVYARDFYADPTDWQSVCPALSVTLENARNRAHREVGHLTTARIARSPDNKAWKIKELTDEIAPIIRTFCEKADKTKLDTSVISLLR